MPHKHSEPDRPFDVGIVLSGGGARGLAHVGVLRALNHLGIYPSVVVGVSMGAVVGATYALNPDWYDRLVETDFSGVPPMPEFTTPGIMARLRALRDAERTLTSMYFGWGVGQSAIDWGRGLLRRLTLGQRLEEGRVPVIATATDMLSGERVDIHEGPAVDALYASSALAGILPPAEMDGRMLIDGGYADLAPVDLARAAGARRVIAVDASTSFLSSMPNNGIQVMLRGIEICQNEHAALRFAKADLLIRPIFDPPVATLDFGRKRNCIAAGIWSVLRSRQALSDLLN